MSSCPRPPSGATSFPWRGGRERLTSRWHIQDHRSDRVMKAWHSHSTVLSLSINQPVRCRGHLGVVIEHLWWPHVRLSLLWQFQSLLRSLLLHLPVYHLQSYIFFLLFFFLNMWNDSILLKSHLSTECSHNEFPDVTVHAVSLPKLRGY